MDGWQGLFRWALVWVVLVSGGGTGRVPAVMGQEGPAPELGFDAAHVFDETWNLVKNEFYSVEQVGQSWDLARDTFRPRALKATHRDEFATVMGDLLRTLKTSHTAYFPTTHPKRYELLGVFEFLAPADRVDLLEYDSIGIDTVVIEGKNFVRSVYDGFPAAAGGVVFGDEIVAVDGRPFHPIESFRGKQHVELELRRSAAGPIETRPIDVVRCNGRTLFEKALAASARTLERDGHSIAYVHVWSYAGSKYQDQLRNLLLFGDLRRCEALVLDLRDGWGGASLEYLHLFREPIAQMTSRPRTGEPTNYSGAWGKPVVLLVNERSTSGKELFAYGFKKLKLGPIVGATTAGAVVAGKGTLLSNGDVLYLAVSDVQIDGERLEGKGVEPTIPVARPIPYAQGADPQLDRAVEEALRAIR